MAHDEAAVQHKPQPVTGIEPGTHQKAAQRSTTEKGWSPHCIFTPWQLSSGEVEMVLILGKSMSLSERQTEANYRVNEHLPRTNKQEQSNWAHEPCHPVRAIATNYTALPHSLSIINPG